MEKECKKNICYCLNEKCTCKHNEFLKNSALFYRDEFAIGFAEWCAVRDYMHINKQLLEIYKRENEL
jgi:hypothetical protein